MRGGSKTLIAAIAVLLLAAGLAACGGGDDSSSITTEAVAQGPSGGESNRSASSQRQAGNGGEGNSGTGDTEGKPGGAGGSSGNFVPKPHSDSGGGSEQFRVKGGDNSVQEFGAEAEASELDQAATALHDFLDARAAGDWAAACAYMAKSIAQSLEKLAAQAKQVGDKSCAGVLGKLTNPAAMGALRTEAEQADVGSLRVEGERAFVVYTGAGGAVLAMPMANEGGSWKVASLAGTPLH